MAVSAGQFAREFTTGRETGPGLDDPNFWREAIRDGSISSTRTARASVEVQSPRGTTYWVFPGEVINLRAQGWSIGSAPAPAARLGGPIDPSTLAEGSITSGIPFSARVTQPAAVTGGPVTVRNKQTQETLSVDQATADSMTSMWPETWQQVPGAAPAPPPTPSNEAEVRAGQIKNIEAEILTRAIKGEFTGAGMDETGDPVKAALLEAGLSVDEANTSLITLGNSPDWQRVFAEAPPVPTAPPVPVAEVPGRVTVVNNETGERQEVSQAAAERLVRMSPDIWEIVGPVPPPTPAPVPTPTPGGKESEGIENIPPYSTADLKFFSDRWASGDYDGNQEQVIADMVEMFDMPEISARALFNTKRIDGSGLFLGDGKGAPDGGFADPGGPTGEPESLFARFARARSVAPEAGETPAMARLRQEFDPVYRGFDLTRRLDPILAQTYGATGEAGLAADYEPPTFQDYLATRGKTEQSGRMSSRNILAQLNAMKQAGREEAGFRFGNVYTQGGDYIPLGPDAPMTRVEQNQLFEDAAAAQYGRRGGEFVGRQIARDREMFGGQRKMGRDVTGNFFDYIRDKYRLNLGV